jgi:ribosomal protein S18 acetylase RimI-like enzyme
MDASGFDPEMVERLLQQQFELQRAGYRDTYPLAQTHAIVVGDEVVGRLIVDVSGDRVVLVDIMIDPSRQRQGIGTHVLCDLIARHAERTIELHVDLGSPAEGWYRRLGFEQIGADELQAHMIRVAA